MGVIIIGKISVGNMGFLSSTEQQFLGVSDPDKGSGTVCLRKLCLPFAGSIDWPGLHEGSAARSVQYIHWSGRVRRFSLASSRSVTVSSSPVQCQVFTVTRTHFCHLSSTGSIHKAALHGCFALFTRKGVISTFRVQHLPGCQKQVGSHVFTNSDVLPELSR